MDNFTKALADEISLANPELVMQISSNNNTFECVLEQAHSGDYHGYFQILIFDGTIIMNYRTARQANANCVCRLLADPESIQTMHQLVDDWKLKEARAQLKC